MKGLVLKVRLSNRIQQSYAESLLMAFQMLVSDRPGHGSLLTLPSLSVALQMQRSTIDHHSWHVYILMHEECRPLKDPGVVCVALL